MLFGEVSAVQPVNIPTEVVTVDVVSIALIVTKALHPLNISPKFAPLSVASACNDVRAEQS